jgi:hypothetical protein
MTFRAAEDVEVRRVAFAWRARVSMAPLIFMMVEDAYQDGAGWLEGRLWGRKRMFRHEGAEMAESERLRYLAEIFWVPHAITANPELVWAEDGNAAVTVAAATAPDRKVRLEFDAAGDIVMASAMRGRLEGKVIVQRPWRGVVTEYAARDGVRHPRRAEVAWELPDGWFTYWAAEVTGMELQAG